MITMRHRCHQDGILLISDAKLNLEKKPLVDGNAVKWQKKSHKSYC